MSVNNDHGISSVTFFEFSRLDYDNTNIKRLLNSIGCNHEVYTAIATKNVGSKDLSGFIYNLKMIWHTNLENVVIVCNKIKDINPCEICGSVIEEDRFNRAIKNEWIDLPRMWANANTNNGGPYATPIEGTERFCHAQCIMNNNGGTPVMGC